MGSSQPFMYTAYQQDPRFHTPSFDPRAVTRASREPKPEKPKPTGPLVSFNRHPDAHVVFQPSSSQYTPLGRRTKAWMRWLRRLQLSLRLLQLIGAAGILVIFSLLTKVSEFVTWAVRIVQAVTISHCLYATYHLSRRAAGRTAASSAAYQFFAFTLDFLSTVAYILGVLVVHGKASKWGTILNDQNLMDYFVPAIYYTMMAASVLHCLTLSSSIWLGWVFRKISHMPPDMNPTEEHLISKPLHKRNKSSVGTEDTYEGEKRPWTQSDSRRNSSQHTSRPSISFMDTRIQSRESTDSRLPRVNLPSRQYQIVAGSPGGMSASPVKAKHKYMSGSPDRGSYADVPLSEADPIASDAMPPNDGLHGEYVMSSADQDASVMAAVSRGRRSRGSKSYSALKQIDDMIEDSLGLLNEKSNRVNSSRPGSDHFYSSYPNPLGSHPTSPDQYSGQVKSALRPLSSAKALDYGGLPEISSARDIVDKRLNPQEFAPRQRDSSIQTEEFFSVSNGQSTDATSPILIGETRKVSGNDYASRYSFIPHDRRNPGGKTAEDSHAHRSFLYG